MRTVEFAIEIEEELYNKAKEICDCEGTTPEILISAFIRFASDEKNKEELIKILKG